MSFSLKPLNGFLLATLVWLIMAAVAITTRPIFAVDETRYLAVAWEMWLRDDWLVPHLNGVPYHHKPPLLFWLINAGWKVFGVSELWARSVAPLFTVATLLVVTLTAKRLWPKSDLAGFWAPLMVLGFPLWAGAGSLTMFDTMLAFWAALGIFGLVLATDRHMVIGFLLYTLSIGLGILTKGPVVLVFLLPPALLVFVWRRERWDFNDWIIWYLACIFALLVGALMALSWALPAAKAGGEAFENALLWGQTAGRVVDSFAHKRSWWWYGAVLLPILLPWTAWFGFWRGLVAEGRRPDRGTRLLFIWIAVPLVFMTFISAKQVQYLLPLFPAVALLAARILSVYPARTLDAWLPAGLVGVLGIALIAVPFIAIDDLPAWVSQVSPLPGLTMVVLAVGMVIAARRSAANVPALLTAIAPVLFLSLHLGVLPYLAPLYAVDRTAAYVAEIQKTGANIAFLGKYHGQFQFTGRLRQPIETVRHEDLDGWLETNPDRLLVAVVKNPGAETLDATRHWTPFRSRYLTVWTADQAVKHRDALR